MIAPPNARAGIGLSEAIRGYMADGMPHAEAAVFASVYVAPLSVIPSFPDLWDAAVRGRDAAV